MKKLILVLFVIGLIAPVIGQETNRCWSIDYETWNTTGTPNLFIDCGNDDAFNMGAEMTLEVWLRAYTFGENRKVMGKVHYNDPIDNGYVLGFENLHVYAEYFNPTNQQVPRPGDGPIPADSSFTHIVSTYSSVTGKVQSYVNGLLVGETTMFPSTAVVSNDRPFIIGLAPWDTLSYQYYGDMDEVRIWNVALTQEEIQANMHKQLTGNEVGLVANYNFNMAEGGSVPDSGPNSFDGALFNFDHISTTFKTSGAPVGDLTMSAMADVGAIWYHYMENYHKLVTENGIIVVTDILEKEFEKYLVVGINSATGVTSTDMPITAPEGFVRTGREWYFNTAGDVGGGLTIMLEDAATNGDFPNGGEADQYVLLYRKELSEPFRAVYGSVTPFENIFQFNDISYRAGYYCLGYSTATFEIEGYNSVGSILDQGISLFPNPCTDHITITDLKAQSLVKIYDMQSRLVVEKRNVNRGTNRIDLSHLNSGIYLLYIESEQSQAVQKIIKK